jgi:hypothetical protein
MFLIGDFKAWVEECINCLFLALVFGVDGVYYMPLRLFYTWGHRKLSQCSARDQTIESLNLVQLAFAPIALDSRPRPPMVGR